MPLFIDTSALVKLYVEERGSGTMQIVAARPDLQDGFFASKLVALEVLGLFGKRLRKKELGRKGYKKALHEFGLDFPDRIHQVEITSSILDLAVFLASDLAERNLSPMDVAHLATALVLTGQLKDAGLDHNVVLVASDLRLVNAARRRGLDTFDPESDDPDALAGLVLPLKP